MQARTVGGAGAEMAPGAACCRPASGVRIFHALRSFPDSETREMDYRTRQYRIGHPCPRLHSLRFTSVQGQPAPHAEHGSQAQREQSDCAAAATTTGVVAGAIIPGWGRISTHVIERAARDAAV